MAADSSTDEYVNTDGFSDSSDSDIGDRITSRPAKENIRPSHSDGQNATSGEPVSGAHSAHRESHEAAGAFHGSSRDGITGPRSSSQKTVRETSRVRSQSVDSATGVLTTEYRDLLNEMIADASGQATASDIGLSSSQIGATFWSAREKDALFQALEKLGEGDVARLEFAVCTKSQHEIQVYLSVLREGLVALLSSNTRDAVQLCDISAAAEVPNECGSALNDAADSLSSRVETTEQLAERAYLQENWLIDAESAEREEQDYEEALKVEAGVAGDIDAAPASNVEEPGAVGLLRHAMFLQLSRNLFMNHEQEDLNWQHVDLVTDVTKEPAMFRRAAGDFHDIVVSVTRRLVQASIFQAMSRLRASDSSRADWSPLATVRETDVRSAAKLVNMSPSWNDYWAGVARRCRVKVYSDSKKYNDGRSGTKSGYRLTCDEVEAELGVQQAEHRSHAEDDSTDILEDDIDGLMDASDAFTDDPATADTAPSDDPDEIGNQPSQPSKSGQRRKRSRTQNPASHNIAQDADLDALDRVRSAQEQVRLWQVVRLAPPDSTVDTSLLSVRFRSMQKTANGDSPTRSWRSALQYMAGWEVQSGQPQSKSFRDMAMAGRRGRKRRRLLEATVHARLASREQGRLYVTGPKVEEAASSGEDSVATDDFEGPGLTSND